jgi:hypothetical protein
MQLGGTTTTPNRSSSAMSHWPRKELMHGLKPFFLANQHLCWTSAPAPDAMRLGCFRLGIR